MCHRIFSVHMDPATHGNLFVCQNMASQPQLNGSQAWVPQLGHNGPDRAQPLTRRPLEELLTALRKVL